MNIRKIFFILALLCARIISLSAQTLRVEVPNLVAVDEQFTVLFVFEGENKPSGFEWNPGNDFELVWGPQQGSSTSIQIINGKQSKSVQFTYTYILLPKSVGKFTLPSARAEVNGHELTSGERTIEVVSEGASAQSQSSSSQSSQSSPSASGNRQGTADVSGDEMFLKMTLSRTNVVLGEPILATLKLYQRVNITGIDDAKLPTFNGFWSQDITPDGDIQFVRESIDGKIYNAGIIKKYVLMPQQAGTLLIEPAEMVCRVAVRVSSGGNSIFDGFFDDYTTVRKRVSTPGVKVNVSALPSGAPASFGGGVGNFNISAKLSKDALSTHEAASLLVTVSGRGNVTLLEAPKVSFPPDVEVYDTKTTDNIDKSSGGTSGSRTYEFPFIPRSHGDFEIEPIKYSYYDVATGKYITLSTEPIHFTVEKGNETEAAQNPGIVVPAGVNKKGVANLNQDIRFISTKAPSFKGQDSLFVASGLFWVLVILLLAVAVISYFSFRKIAERRADVVGAKTRKATKMALKRLKLAGQFLSQNLYSAFYEELHKALLGYISDKLNMPASDLSKENISRRLSSAAVDETLVNEFISVLDACEYARYAPDSGHEAMKAHYDEAVSVISLIDPKMKTKNSAAVSSVVSMLLLLSLPFAAGARNADYADSLWNAATGYYSEGSWEEAADAYSAIMDAQAVSKELYFNIGNCYFKTGEHAKAILFYERALKLDPSYEDARYNLEVAGNYVQDDIESVPEFILKTWTRNVSHMLDSNAWAVTFLVLFALALVMVLVFLMAPSVAARKAGFFSAIVLVLLAVGALSFSLWQKNEYQRQDTAIVMRPVTPVKSSPSSDKSSDLFILHEGTKVEILDSVGEWKNISLSDGRQGWLKASDIEII